MKKQIIFALLWLGALAAVAQQKQGLAMKPIPFNYGINKQTKIGTSKMRVLYAFQPKDMNDEETWIDCGQLLFDGGLTKYSSRFLEIRDSSLLAWRKEHPHADHYPNAINLKGYHRAKWIEYQYSQIFTQNGELTEWAVMPQCEYQQYRYKEPYPNMKWKLEKETKVICGYACQKATCTWRGRDYIAWFTQDIPLKSGPWKFGGLPGLILKVHDTKFFYKWEAVAIQNGRFPIMQLDKSKFKDSTRKKVWQMQYDYNYKYAELAGLLYNMRPVTKRFPYEQLEKE